MPCAITAAPSTLTVRASRPDGVTFRNLTMVRAGTSIDVTAFRRIKVFDLRSMTLLVSAETRDLVIALSDVARKVAIIAETGPQGGVLRVRLALIL